jgi:hypothetical protein
MVEVELIVKSMGIACMLIFLNGKINELIYEFFA